MDGAHGIVQRHFSPVYLALLNRTDVLHNNIFYNRRTDEPIVLKYR